MEVYEIINGKKLRMRVANHKCPKCGEHPRGIDKTIRGVVFYCKNKNCEVDRVEYTSSHHKQ